MILRNIRKLVDNFLDGQTPAFSESWKNDLASAASALEGLISEKTIEALHQKKIKKSLENAVDTFLAGQREKSFSICWRNDLVERTLKVDSSMPNQFIKYVYDLKIHELRKNVMKALLRKFGVYNNFPEKAEDIVNIAFAKWWKSFNGSEPRKTDNPNRAQNPEYSYLLRSLKSAQSDVYGEENPEVVIKLKDADRNPLKDAEGKQIKLRIPSTHLEYAENAYDAQDDGDEENTYSDGLLPDLEGSELTRNVTENEESLSEDVNSHTYPEKHLVQIGGPSPDNTFSEKTRMGLTKFGDKYFASVAASQISKFYFLSGKADFNRSRRAFTEMELSYKPARKAIADQIRPELLNITSATIYHKNRLRYLKFADSRQWMELAISELRKSKAKMTLDAKKRQKTQRNFDEDKFRNKTPLLSAVVIDKDGNLVATCFKGQKNQILKDRGDITWDKHCEYSLFTEIIKEQNMHLIIGGVLFVTLEPCNKRTSYMEAGKSKPKIPCAVRCVEAGLSKIYIGSYDHNPVVKTKGERILKTGEYSFGVKKKNFDVENEKERRDADLLKSYFDSKKYQRTITDNEIIYKIGNPVEVVPFDSDLQEEILALNAGFLRHHEEGIYRKYE